MNTKKQWQKCPNILKTGGNFMELLNVYLTNLGKYNEGELVGEWFHLPAEEEEIEAAMKRIGIGKTDQFGQLYEEYFITDYDSYIGDHGYGEYADIYEINEKVKEIADCVTTEDELEIFKAILDDIYDIDEAISIFRNQDYVNYSDCKTMYEVAEEIIYECGYLQDAPKLLADFFDYEAFGRALDINEHFVQMENGGYIQITR